jgi:hypothetical protein
MIWVDQAARGLEHCCDKRIFVAKKKNVQADSSEIESLVRIKRLAIIAMFSDDELMERFVLKGGNALDLVLHVGTRASLDIDLSMENDFNPSELQNIWRRLEHNLQATFNPEGYQVFDVKLESKPETLSEELAAFWGGYQVTFKLIESGLQAEFAGDLGKMRRNAVLIGARGKFEIDISRFEYCRDKQGADFDGYRIYVYTPEMLVCEKLRAICQQMPEYGPVVKRTRPSTARARDFVDIHTAIERFGLDLLSADNTLLLKNIFEAKRVPLGLLGRVADCGEFHRPDFEAVRATVKPGVLLQDFDFYFGYVVSLCGRVSKALGNV